MHGHVTDAQWARDVHNPLLCDIDYLKLYREPPPEDGLSQFTFAPSPCMYALKIKGQN
jgi:hypothetical protein